MGFAFYRLKIGLYVFAVILVGVLFVVRIHNALQKSGYRTHPIYGEGDVAISVNFPAKILSPKNENSYPLTLSFTNLGDVSQAHVYEITFESSSLLFVDAEGVEIEPRLQIAGNRAFLEQNIHIRPFLAEEYPVNHKIAIQVWVDGQKPQVQPAPIEIKTEPRLFSFLSLAAASLLEVSIVVALVTWIANAIDTALNLKREKVNQRRNDLNSLSALPLLERMDRFVDLVDQIRREGLEDELRGDILQIERVFRREQEQQGVREFLRALGEHTREGIL